MLTGIDSSLPFTLRTWPDRLSLVLFPARVATVALGVMGLLAAMLAVTGVFGMARTRSQNACANWASGSPSGLIADNSCAQP